jgi:hypothetical protein
LVAYYVRDVGAGSSSLLTPTNEKAWHGSAGLCFVYDLSSVFLKLALNMSNLMI